MVRHQLADVQAKQVDPQRVITDLGIDELSLKAGVSAKREVQPLLGFFRNEVV